jgi:hypothetical protein
LQNEAERALGVVAGNLEETGDIGGGREVWSVLFVGIARRGIFGDSGLEAAGGQATGDVFIAAWRLAR